jgi:hypothetical protein
MEISKQDWLLYRKKIGEWQEAYMEKLLLEYAELLRKESLASERFWELDKRIKNDKRSRGVVIEVRKQNVVYDLVAMILDGIIAFDDLEDFSDDLKDAVRFMVVQRS